MSHHAEVPQKTILVTGATGQQGGAVARHLLKSGAYHIRALVRDPNKPQAKNLAEKGAELVKGDLYDRASLDAALPGVYGVYSVQNFWLPDVGFEGEIKQGKLLADATKEADVKHFVYSSVGAAHRGMGQKHFESKWQIERYIQQRGLPYTILRPAAFMDNFNWTRPQILNGQFQSYGLRPDKTLQLVAVDDIGAFARLVFDNPQEFLGKTIELAGDELSEQQIVDTLTRVIGREVRLVQPETTAGATPAPEQLAIFQFINGQGYDADIFALRERYPSLQSLETYLRRNGWENAEPVPMPAGGWQRWS
jgi:uncharacterized protein YbjT (DUF2867 family)